MAYVPVQRDEGRILYQSTMDRAKLMGDTLTNLGETLYKREEENKAFRAKNTALKQLIATHKDKFGLDEATAKQFLNGDPNKSEKENYLTLASFLEGNVTAANLAKDQASMKRMGLESQKLEEEIAQQKKLGEIYKGMMAGSDTDVKKQAENAAMFASGTPTGPSAAAPVAPVAAAAAPTVSAPPAQPAASSRFRRVPDASAAPADGMPVTPRIQPSQGAFSPPAAFGMPMVPAAQPIDQYRALRPSDVSFAPAALAAAQFAGPMASARGVLPPPVSVPAPAVAPVAPTDRVALEAARQKFDEAIAAPDGQFTLPKSTLSPEAKAIAKKLRDEFDDLSAISEKKAGSSRLTAAEDDSKGATLKKKRTITLDEEGIKAILSNPRILVESFGDVMGDPYTKAVRNQATDAEFARNVKLRELERQFGLGSRTNVRRGK